MMSYISLKHVIKEWLGEEKLFYKIKWNKPLKFLKTL